MFRKTLVTALLCGLALAGCGGSDAGTIVSPDSCSIAGQNQFVLDTMRDVYLWNDLLPSNVNINAYNSPEALLAFLTSFQPLDSFSFINTAEADSAFFGEGQFEGFGFSSRFEAADDLRLTRVFADGPAGRAGFERGQRIVALDGRSIADIEAAEGVAAVFDLSPLEFTMRRPDNSEFVVTLTQDVVTIDPLPQWRVIDTGTAMAGYMELATFISTADPVFDTIFAEFRQAGVNDVIIDMRYNGGGLVSTAELLGDYFGGDVADGLVFSKTLFNGNNTASNRTEFFERQGNSMSLSRLVVIATSGTASASELVTNSMEPHVEVAIVGDTTFGKPVGQLGITFCEKVLRPTSFETVNANDEGGYFDGLPVDCAAADDLNVAVGDADDPNVVAALEYLDTGACPAVQTTVAPAALSEPVPRLDLRGPPWREFAGAF
ncbi:MAG: hypothetical protein KJO31_01805 [Gammaproteobacteria bacterium]|nr:hypothetical protein [Gammaproteobacteria bacterium]